MKAMKERRGDARLNRLRPAGAMLAFQDGMSALPKRIASLLGEERCSAGFVATRICRVEGGWEIESARERLRAKRLVLAVPAYRAAPLLESVDSEIAKMVGGIPYAGIAVTGLGFHRDQIKHPLNGFGYLCPEVTNSPILGCLFSSSIFPGARAPKDHVLLRVMAGGSRHPERVDTTQEERCRNALSSVRSVLKIQGEPVFKKDWSHTRAIPQYELGHKELVDDVAAALDAKCEGLWLSGQAYRGLGIIDCVLQAKAQAEQIAGAT